MYCFCLSIDNRSGSKKWREMMENVEFFDMCMCIVFAFQLIRAKEVRIDIEVKRSEKKWREVTWSDDLWRFACGDVLSTWCLSPGQVFANVKSSAVDIWWVIVWIEGSCCNIWTSHLPLPRYSILVEMACMYICSKKGRFSALWVREIICNGPKVPWIAL